MKFKDITLLIENKVGILKEGRFILPLSIMVELAFFTLCLINAQLLLRTMLVLPSLFIIPGALLLTVLRRSIDNIIKLTVESFFVSILMSVLLTSIMLALGLPLIPFNYSLAILIVTLFLSIIALIRKIEFKPSESGTLLVIVAFLAYVALLAYFSGLPRLFTPDETSYIFSVRMGILDGAVPPMGVRPNTGEINALFHGRYFWTYLLASFIGSTGLPAHQAGLLGASFLVVTALASSLFVEKKWLRTAVFTLVTLNPLLLLFSALTLNDLAISFYAVFSVLFFVKSFSKNGDNVSINIRNLLCSLLGLIVLTMIKPNLLVFVVMWIILVFIMFRYKFYKQNWKYKVSLIAVVLPVLIYELCIDVPYVVSVWVLKNSELGGLFSRFLFISPAERFLGWFSAPWWNPAAPTLFTQGFANYMDYFYRILTPESLSILVSAIILALPILILSRNLRKKLDKTVLILLVILSMWLFYFEALSSANLSGASRYSLWMIPLWIPLAVIVLQDIIKDESPLRKLLSVSIAALILLWVNIWLSKENGGVFVGYGLSSRLWTAPAITIQFILLTVILSLLLLRNYLLKVRLNISKKLSAVTPLNLRRNVFALAIILMLLNGVYFSFQFVESSQRFEDHGLIAINNALDNVSSDSNIVFANNYIYMRPYVNDELLNRGLLLPPPDTEEEFLKLINVAPNNTLFLISNDQATTWYEYGNKYIKNYSGDDILTSDKPTVEDLLKFNLSDAILHMTFDDMNDIISDHSIYKNNGLNDGAQIVEGYSGKALHFNDDEHVTIPNDDTLNVQNAITISFFASIDAAEPGEGHMILSKGYAPINGSYDICIYNSKIYFELSKTNYLSIPIGEYLGEWHHFIFTYNGERMEAIIDGVVVAAKSATGAIKNSNYAVEIGRDSERKACYFNGTIDELQISGKPLNLSDLANTYSKHYAIKILTITGNNGDSTLFKTMNLDCENDGGNVHVDNVEMTIKNDFAVNLDLKLTSDFPTNTTILISTDRFTNVYVTNLTTGTNNVTFEYPYITDSSLYGSGGPYWVHLAQTRITIVVGETIVYNNSISPLIQTSINIYLMLIAGIVLTVYLLITYIKQKLL